MAADLDSPDKLHERLPAGPDSIFNGSSPAGSLFLFLPAELSNIKKQFESLTCIKGEDTHIADFPGNRMSMHQNAPILVYRVLVQAAHSPID